MNFIFKKINPLYLICSFRGKHKWNEYGPLKCKICKINDHCESTPLTFKQLWAEFKRIMGPHEYKYINYDTMANVCKEPLSLEEFYKYIDSYFTPEKFFYRSINVEFYKKYKKGDESEKEFWERFDLEWFLFYQKSMNEQAVKSYEKYLKEYSNYYLNYILQCRDKINPYDCSPNKCIDNFYVNMKITLEEHLNKER
jgi:hypothetical protein